MTPMTFPRPVAWCWAFSDYTSRQAGRQKGGTARQRGQAEEGQAVAARPVPDLMGADGEGRSQD